MCITLIAKILFKAPTATKSLKHKLKSKSNSQYHIISNQGQGVAQIYNPKKSRRVWPLVIQNEHGYDVNSPDPPSRMGLATCDTIQILDQQN